MNPTYSHPTLHILPKPSKTQILRHLEPQRGILWTMIAPIFTQYDWDIQAQTDLFVKAHHIKSDQTIIVSKMGQRQVLISQNNQIFGLSELHEIEDLADMQEPTTRQVIKRPWISRLLMSMIPIMI